jgi:hypothetical protein
MDNQPSTGGSIVPVKRDGEDLVDEQIDERILRLLGLEYIFDIDYDTYTSLLKEKMVAARMAKTQIPTEEAELLTNEYKKIRGKKGRFKVKKITAQSLKRGSAVGVNLGKQKALVGKPQLALPPADKMTGGSDIKEIIDALAEIIKSLTSQNKLAKDSAEKSRIAGEAGQRGAKESRLEKGFKFAIKAAEKIIAPIKSLLDRIIDFFVAIFVGRALIKLLDWFSDSKNQDKIKAIGRFLGDQWPKLLALYIMFGTGLGKFVGFLTKIVIRGGIKLAAAAAGLLAKAGVGKAAGAAKFLGGKGGRFLGAGLQVAAAVGTTMAVSKGIENFGGIGGEEQKTQGYSGGGFVIPKFAGGGLNFKGMMGGAGMGSMFGPLGMLLGAGLGSGKIQETVSGLIGGQKGVDKVPAMLTDGEFVMSRGAVQKYGVDTLESMNAAGGGTNQPKIVSGTTYAAGGGMIGSNTDPDGVKENSPTQGGDDIRKVISLIKHVFGYDVNKPQNWGPPAPPSSSGGNSGGGIAGTVQRRVEYEYNKRFGGGNQSSSGKQLRNDSTSGGIVGTIGSRMKYEYNKRFGGGNKSTPTKGKSGGNANGKNDKSNIIGGLGRQQYREAGMVYGRSLLGGIGGDLTERDFSPESQKILEQAIKRAESRKEQKIIKAQGELAKDPNNLQKKSALERLQKGQVRLEYGDYASKMEVAKDGTHKARYTDKEDDLKNILGQAWFEKQKGGGYKSTNEKYDFQQYKNPLKVLLGMTGEENKEVKKSGVNFQKRLEAFHQILKGAGIAKDLNADVLIGGKRPSISNQSQYKASGMAKYSAANISRVQRSRVSPPTQPSRPAPKIVYGGSGAKSTFQNTGGNGRYGKPSVPSFSAVHPNSESRRRNAAVLGVK